MKTLCTIIVLSFCFSFCEKGNAQAPGWEWAKSFGSNTNDESHFVTLDTLGNVYTTGRFSGTVDFDPDLSGTFYLTSAGTWDIFISKLDSSGNFIWAKSMGGTSDDVGYKIAFDAPGNIYLTGYFSATVDFDPGIGTYNLTSLGSLDIYVCKLDNTGNFVWATSMGGAIGDAGHCIIVEPSGDVYISGTFQGTVDFDPGVGIYNLTTGTDNNIFLCRYDNTGNFIWAKSMGGMDGSTSFSIALDANGNIYTTGWFEGTSDFDPGIGTFNLTAAGLRDIFISKLSNSGNFIWAKAMGSTGFDAGVFIVADAVGNLYVTGSFEGTVDFDPDLTGIYNLTSAGLWEIFISKLNSSGNFVWAKAIGGAGSDGGQSLALDSGNNVYTTGYFNGTIDFDPGIGTFNLASAGGDDIFISKLSGSGNFVWAKSVGGIDDEEGYSLTMSATGNVYVTGIFRSSIITFDTTTLTNVNGTGFSQDIFIAKLDNAITGIESPENTNGVSVYPNPFSNELLVYSSEFGNKTEIIIFDLFGRKILSQPLLAATTQLNTSYLAKGIYIYEVRNKAGEVQKGKVIKE